MHFANKGPMYIGTVGLELQERICPEKKWPRLSVWEYAEIHNFLLTFQFFLPSCTFSANFWSILPNFSRFFKAKLSLFGHF